MNQPDIGPYPEVDEMSETRDPRLMLNLGEVTDRYASFFAWPPNRYQRLIESLADAVAPMLAEAERRGAEKAWDEGHAAHDLAPDMWVNPYRKAAQK